MYVTKNFEPHTETAPGRPAYIVSTYPNQIRVELLAQSQCQVRLQKGLAKTANGLPRQKVL